jgi:hypothetical protein
MLDFVLAVDTVFACIGLGTVIRFVRKAVQMRNAMQKVRGFDPNQRPFDQTHFHAPTPEDLER